MSEKPDGQKLQLTSSAHEAVGAVRWIREKVQEIRLVTADQIKQHEKINRIKGLIADLVLEDSGVVSGAIDWVSRCPIYEGFLAVKKDELQVPAELERDGGLVVTWSS